MLRDIITAKKKSILIALLLAAVLAGLSYFIPRSAIDRGKTLWELSLSQMNFTGDRAEARIADRDGRVWIALELASGDRDVKRPAYIHIGKCGGPSRTYAKYRLTDMTDGNSETLIDISPDDFAKDLPLSIQVSQSFDDVYLGAACGTIER